MILREVCFDSVNAHYNKFISLDLSRAFQMVDE